MDRFNLLLAVLVIIILTSSCGESLRENGSPQYLGNITAWHQERIDNLKKENGWLNLVGLFWLKEGENKFGNGKENDLIFPERVSPAQIGKLVLNDSVVTVEINNGIEVWCEGEKITKQIMINDIQGKPTILEYGQLRWFVIKRGNKYGIRLRNLDAPLVKDFEGIETFPINFDWNLEASFENYNPPKRIVVPNILGTVEEENSPGALLFNKDGIEYRLDVLDGGNSYFVVFADETSGKETYGGGRFSYVTKADSSGKIFIDFNKAYNPPCVFTKFATCPLPPKQNYLKMRVTSGEKVYEHGDH